MLHTHPHSRRKRKRGSTGDWFQCSEYDPTRTSLSRDEFCLTYCTLRAQCRMSTILARIDADELPDRDSLS